MLNINRLKGKIVEKGVTITRLAELIEMDRSTLYRKLGNPSDKLSIREVNKICKALSLTKEEAFQIFFGEFVA